VLTWAQPAPAADTLAADPAWSACRADSDCVGTFDPCGWPAAVNRKSKAAHEGWAAMAGASIRCVAPPKDKGRDIECVRRRCEALPKEGRVEKRQRKECEAKGGRWGGLETGRGRTPGCTPPAADGGKACSDGTQCSSGACLQDQGDASGKPRCYEWRTAPKGCYLFWERGRAANRCID